MIFQAPVDSPSHRALLDAASVAGEDREALKRLLWLINAHPTLVAHVRVFESLLAHIDSSLCNSESLYWAGEWKVDIPAWHSICTWVSKQKTSLSRMVELELFDEQPRNELHNPHLNSGVGRHGVAAALWSPGADTSQSTITLRRRTYSTHPQSATSNCKLICS